MYVDYPDWRDAKYNSDQFLCFRKDGGEERQKQGFIPPTSLSAVL
jgi:hypothetical protein